MPALPRPVHAQTRKLRPGPTIDLRSTLKNRRCPLVYPSANKDSRRRPETVVSFSNAGKYVDLAAWQRAWNLRAQVRQAKRDMKLKHAALVGGPGIKKPPRVIREAEQVEQLLTDIVDNPKGCGKTLPDYAALEQRVRAALTNDPFESNRSLPEFDPESRQGTELTKGAKFTAEEIQTISNRLRGADLPAWLWSGK